MLLFGCFLKDTVCVMMSGIGPLQQDAVKLHDAIRTVLPACQGAWRTFNDAN